MTIGASASGPGASEPSASGTVQGESIPLCVPVQGGRERFYLEECLRENWLSSMGPMVGRFERAIGSRVGRTGVALSSGTAALHLGLLVAGVHAGDLVAMPTLTFIASANAVRYLGAAPALLDVDPVTGQLSPAVLRKFLTEECEFLEGKVTHRSTGRRVAALMPVHLLGRAAPMRAILAVAREFNLITVVDAAEAMGVMLEGAPVETFGDIVCLSFNGNKIMTTGGGGMVLTENQAWAERAAYLSKQAKDDSNEFIHHAVGFNYRMTSLEAAVGLAQLDHLEQAVEAKRRIADRYRRGLADVEGIAFMEESAWERATYWLSAIQLSPARFGMDRKGLGRRLADQGIESRPLWQPMHRSPAHQSPGLLPPVVTPAPAAERLYDTVLCLPSSANLSTTAQQRVIDAIRSAAPSGSRNRSK